MPLPKRIYLALFSTTAALLNYSLLFSSCQQKQVPKTDTVTTVAKKWDQTIPGSFSSQKQQVFDSSAVSSFVARYPLFKSYAPDIESFYRKRKFAYAWFEKGKLIEQAGNLANRVANLKREGIYSTSPYQKKLDSLLYNSLQKKPDTQLELMLTAQYFVFSKMAWNGLNATVSKNNNWYLPRKKLNYDQYLDSLLTNPGREINDEEPVYRQYDLLKSFLKKYHDLDEREPWARIGISTSIKPGESDPLIKAVKRRLFLLEDFKGDTTDAVYNPELLEAIKSCQARMGLTVNGRLNTATLAELNTPLKSRIKQIVVNMERSRWVPVSLDGDYLGVNIPEFKLHVYHGDTLLWSCNVVVGQTVHQTTIFYGEVQYVVFSPYWNVPPGILRNEIIPGMKRNSNYLAEHQMQLTGYEGGLPVVRQKPGPQNSLGLVKFLFPNSYNIYLHDTPSKSLFGETTRAFSHGCIRVGEPAKLAGFLLKDNPAWTSDKIYKAMHAGTEQYVTLKPKIPVFIAYFTAFTDRDHKLNFRKDIYNLDDRLAATIMSGEGEY